MTSRNFQNLTILLFLVLFNASQAQSNAEFLRELNRDVWKPFVEGVNTNNPAMYNGVNAEEFYWVQDGTHPRIMNLAEYVEDARLVMKNRTDKGMSTSLEIRFIQRNVTSEFASEKCIIKYTASTPGKEPQEFYGLAHVFSRKKAGIWRKVIQHTSTEPASKEQFEMAQPIE